MLLSRCLAQTRRDLFNSKWHNDQDLCFSLLNADMYSSRCSPKMLFSFFVPLFNCHFPIVLQWIHRRCIARISLAISVYNWLQCLWMDTVEVPSKLMVPWGNRWSIANFWCCFDFFHEISLLFLYVITNTPLWFSRIVCICFAYINFFWVPISVSWVFHSIAHQANIGSRKHPCTAPLLCNIFYLILGLFSDSLVFYS